MHYGNDTPSPAWTETGKAPSELALHSQGEKPVLLKGPTSQDHTVINPFISRDSLQRWATTERPEAPVADLSEHRPQAAESIRGPAGIASPGPGIWVANSRPAPPC